MAVAQEEAVVEVSNYWLDKKKSTHTKELKGEIEALTAENRALNSKLIYKTVQVKYLTSTIESLVSQIAELKKKD